MRSFLYVLIVFMAGILLLPAGCKVEGDTIIDTLVIYDTVLIKEVDRPINLKASKGDYGNRIIINWTPMPLTTNYQLFKFDKDAYYMVYEGPDTIFTDLSGFTAYEKVFYKVRISHTPIEFSGFSDVDYGYTSGRNYSRYFSFGYQGSAEGLFSFAMHVEVDKQENIYVSDEGNDRVQKFNPVGAFEAVFFRGSGARAIAFLENGNTIVTRTQSSSYVLILDPQKNVVRQWGSYGSGDNQFGNIEEIAVDDEQNIYIVDGINNYVKKFDQNGNFILKFQAAERIPTQVDGAYPFGICYFNNKIFVTSPRNGIIRVFNKTGQLLYTWDSGSPAYAIKAFGEHLYIACINFIMKTDEMGEVREKIGEEELNASYITGLAVNREGDIIVSAVYDRKIHVFKQL